MNTPDPEELEEQFARLLEKYGEALAAGRTPNPMNDPAVPEAIRSRLRDAVAGLQLLQVVWPQTQPAVRDTASGGEVRVGSTAADPSASAGQRFRILRSHARGGLGEVFVARDEELHREVALKEMQERHAGSPQMRARFLVEAEITAGLEHPGVVPVYGLGQYADGRPFYAMRFIRGESLKDAIEKFHNDESLERAPGKKTVAFRELLGRFVAVCHAIAYAHSRGVVHRDVKPSNVMLGKYGETLVVDWGLAKTIGRQEAERTEEETLRPALTSDSGKTLPGSAVGTPAFMSPEQAAGRVDRLGPASDVYSLGATLYCLLTGQSPFAQTEVGEVLRKVERGEFPPPRQVRRTVPAALEAICLKAMALRPEDRYASPSALAEDLERGLADEPVSAWREPWSVRAGRWLGRHRPLVSAGVAAVLMAVVLLTGATLLLTAAKRESDANARRADEQSRQATEEKERARHHLYISTMNLAQTAWRDAQIGRVLDLLNGQRPQGEEDDLRGFEWHYLWRLCHSDLLTMRGHSGSISSVAYSPDGTRLASAGRDGTIRVWDATTGREVLLRTVPTAPVSILAFSPKGQHLASASEDGTVILWDPTTGRKTATSKRHSGSITSLAFSPDGELLASASLDETVRIWDATTGKETAALKGHKNAIQALAFYPDGLRLATPSSDGTVIVWNPRTGQRHPTLALSGRMERVFRLVFSPDCKRLASASLDGAVRVWDTTTGGDPITLKGHSDAVTSVAFSPDGQRLASASHDRIVRVWDTTTGEETLAFKGHSDGVSSVAFSPDGRRLASASPPRQGVQDPNKPCEIKIWDATRPQECLTCRGHSGVVYDLAYSPDGKHVASAGADSKVRIWDATTGEETLTLKGHTDVVRRLAYSRPDGQRLASASHDRTVKVWEVTTGEEVFTLKGHTDQVGGLVYSPDGKHIASASLDGMVYMWDGTTGQPLFSFQGHAESVYSLVYSPDGKRLASAGRDRTVKLWDAATGRHVYTLRGHGGTVVSVAYSPDGKRLASASLDGTVKIWDATTGQELFLLQGQMERIQSVAFSPDGRRLASAGLDGTVKVWDATTGQETLALKGHTAPVTSVAFSPDGTRLASCSFDKTVKVWDATPVP